MSETNEFVLKDTFEDRLEIDGADDQGAIVVRAHSDYGVILKPEQIRALRDYLDEVLGEKRVLGTATVKVAPDLSEFREKVEEAKREVSILPERKAAYEAALELVPYEADPRAVVQVAYFLVGEG